MANPALKKNSTGTQQQLSEQEQAERKKQLEKAMALLVHASSCRNQQCPSINCGKFHALFSHGIGCPHSIAGGCLLCRRLWLLLEMHAKDCTDIDCPVPRCRELRLVQNSRAGARAGETAGTAAEEAASTDVANLLAALKLQT